MTGIQVNENGHFPGKCKIPGKKRETTTDEFKTTTLIFGSSKSV